MTEGADDDVRTPIDIDEVVDLWNELVLPRHVRWARAAWLHERRSVTLPC
ncbi:hypothetical protein BH24ACT5_BH24ACT5_11670 [soil metagenome]